MDTFDLFFDEVKLVSDTTGEFSGVAVTFGTEIPHPVYGADVIRPGAFNRTLAEKGTAGIKMLWAHDVTQPVGRWVGIQENGDGLQVRGQLLMELAKAKEARALMQAGVIDGLSIGFSVPENGSAFDAQKKVRTLRQIDLYEVSLVVFPADTKARIREVKSAHATFAAMVEQIRQLRRLVRSGR